MGFFSEAVDKKTSGRPLLQNISAQRAHFLSNALSRGKGVPEGHNLENERGSEPGRAVVSQIINEGGGLFFCQFERSSQPAFSDCRDLTGDVLLFKSPRVWAGSKIALCVSVNCQEAFAGDTALTKPTKLVSFFLSPDYSQSYPSPSHARSRFPALSSRRSRVPRQIIFVRNRVSG